MLQQPEVQQCAYCIHVGKLCTNMQLGVERPLPTNIMCATYQTWCNLITDTMLHHDCHHNNRITAGSLLLHARTKMVTWRKSLCPVSEDKEIAASDVHGQKSNIMLRDARILQHDVVICMYVLHDVFLQLYSLHS